MEFLLNFWILNFSPPHSMDMPSTSSILPMTDPAREAFTTSNIPAFMATNAMISSVALPKVAFRRPPIFCPQKHAITSVLLPIRPASGMIASELNANSIGAGNPTNSPMIATGRNTSRIHKNFIESSFLPSLSQAALYSDQGFMSVSSVSNRVSGSTGFERWAFSPACMLR